MNTSSGNAQAQNEAGSVVQVIAGKFNALIVAKYLGMDIAYFNRLNPRFDAVLAGNNTFELRLPSDKMELFNAKRYQMLQESVQQMMRFYGTGNGEEQYPNVSELPAMKKTSPKKKN